MFNERFHEAAQRVLTGDESVEAARELEEVLSEDYPGDDRLSALSAALAQYAAGEPGSPTGPEALRTAIREALAAETPVAEG